MKALITGIGGFVASNLARHLIHETDWEIYGTVRWNEDKENIIHLSEYMRGNNPSIRVIESDLNDRGSIDDALRHVKPDYVFHLAAQSYVQASFAYPAQTLQTNIIGTLNLLEAIKLYAPDAWVHNCSSSEVYGRVAREFVPIREDCSFSPASPYSISKIGADFVGRFYHDAHGLRVLTTRAFTHTGAGRGEVFMESTFAKQIAMIEAGLSEPPILVGNLLSLRTIIDVRDMVRAYHMLLTVNPIPGEVYNIGGNYSCTVGDILSALLKEAGQDYPYKQDPTRMRPVDADLQIPDCTKFMKHAGWQPAISFNETIMSLLEYWRGKVK